MTALSQLIDSGLERTQIGFGPTGALSSAAGLRSAGERRFSSTADASGFGMVMSNDRPTVECLLGAIACGARLVSFPAPPRGDRTDYRAGLEQGCLDHGLREIVAEPGLAASLGQLGLPMRGHDQLAARPLAAGSEPGFQLVQFSSGTTQQPKPVVLDDPGLGGNVAATLDRVDPRPGDNVVSWLPLSHDMGLVGMLLASIAGMGPHGADGGTIVLLDPAQFMRAPGLWLELISEHRGTVTAAPDFGLRFAALRPPRGDVDLTSLRCVIVGAEPVRADTLAQFTATYADQGFRAEALCPAYGLAEAGLAVTMTPPAERWRSRRVSLAALADNELAAGRPGEPTIDLVASGPALTGYDTATDGPPSGTGRIAVRGPSIGTDGRTNASFAGRDGWMTTGDEGFLDDGWLYVCGRTDDYLVTHGRNLYAPAIESAVATVPGVRSQRAAAISLPDGTWVVVAETSKATLGSPPAADRLRDDIRREVVHTAGAQPDEILLIGRATMPVTTSGKLRRAELRTRMLAGTITRNSP